MPDMNEQNGVVFRKHPLGFTIIQKSDEKFGSDDHYIFFHGQKILSTPISELKGIRSKKLRGLKRSEERGRAILKNLGLNSKKAHQYSV